MIFLNNKKFLAGTLSLFLLLVLILPVLSLAAATGKDAIGDGLINCGNTVTNGVFKNPCDFSDFIKLINDIINWIIGLATVIFTISAVYGGFLYTTSGMNPGNKEKAKSILWSTLIGFVIILVAWVVIYTILNTLVDRDPVNGVPNVFRFLIKITS